MARPFQLFVTGTDEHGQKMQQTAEKEGIETRALADRNSAAFRKLQETLGSSFDRFIRTTDADHHVASKAIWEKMSAAGDIYLDKYSGWYSVRDEAFHDEADLVPRDRRPDAVGDEPRGLVRVLAHDELVRPRSRLDVDELLLLL